MFILSLKTGENTGRKLRIKLDTWGNHKLFLIQTIQLKTKLTFFTALSFPVGVIHNHESSFISYMQ